MDGHNSKTTTNGVPFLLFLTIGINFIVFFMKAIWSYWEAWVEYDKIIFMGTIILLIPVILAIIGTAKKERWPFVLNVIIYVLYAIMIYWVYQANSSGGTEISFVLVSLWSYICVIITHIVLLLLMSMTKPQFDYKSISHNNRQYGMSILIVSLLFGFMLYHIRSANIDHHARRMLTKDEFYGKDLEYTRAVYTRHSSDYKNINIFFYILTTAGIITGITLTTSRKIQ